MISLTDRVWFQPPLLASAVHLDFRNAVKSSLLDMNVKRSAIFIIVQSIRPAEGSSCFFQYELAKFGYHFLVRSLPFKVVCLSLVLIGMSLHAHGQQQKYALIIGVKSYEYVQPLQNSLNDARDMAAMLKRKGFTVVELYEPKTKREMQDGIRRYFSLIQDKPNAVGLVFYSGHGMQVKGVNYLIPTQADPQIEADLDDQCVNMDYVMRAIEQAGSQLNIFILDACRNNPFRSFNRSAEKGLNMVATPKGSYIVYATKPGSVASDGTGRNGLFTSKLLQYINTEGLNIEQVFKQVARDVAAASGDAQRPWIASDYTGDFYFTTGTSITASQPVTQSAGESKTAPQTSGLDYGYGTTDAPTVIIGTQEWMGKNLNVDHFANGDPIPEARTEDEWRLAGENQEPAWCYNQNDPANGTIYGRLYNWYAVADPRGLAPKGWHIPSDLEWDIVIRHLASGRIVNNPEKISYRTVFVTEKVGSLLKSTGGWKDNGNGENGSGFTGTPGGNRTTKGLFVIPGGGCTWWSSTESSLAEAWVRWLLHSNDNCTRSSLIKGVGISVRCVKDEITNGVTIGDITKKDSTKTDPTKQNLQKLIKKKKN